MSLEIDRLILRVNQGATLVGIIVPAVQQIVGVVLQIAQQARNRGWDVDTASLQDTANRFQAIAETARQERAKYEGRT